MKKNSWLSELSQDKQLPNFTSQRGEDRILAKIFELIGVDSKWCVEFGAADGKRGSNTWHLIHDLGWSAVQIEGKHDKDLKVSQKRDTFEGLQARYKGNKNVTCIDAYVEPAGDRSLDSLLSGTKIPQQFDLLSVDVDSIDYDIWAGLVKYDPRVVVIEHNKTIPVDVDFHSPKGSSLKALTRLGKEKGYELVAVTIVNAVFVKKEDFPKFEIEDNSPAKVWPEHKQFKSAVFQLYDGTVVIQADNKLRWTNGVDGTKEGQVKSGNFIWLDPDDSSLDSSSSKANIQQPAVVSGFVRQVVYKVMDRI